MRQQFDWDLCIQLISALDETEKISKKQLLQMIHGIELQTED